jgi:glycosyltransferase involved in cell wall biosynthesis
MDAMACGLPVACPHGKAFVDYIVDGVNGFLYHASPEGCAAAIARAVSADPAVGANARKTAEEHAIPRSIDMYMALYEEAVAEKRKADG